MGREEELPSVEEFYNGRSVFLTGFTGFMGKVLVEKLLRSCPGIGKIYVLLRNKRGLNPQQRLDKITNSLLFSKLRDLRKDDIKKIIPVVGEMTEPELGISAELLEEIKRDVSVFIHSAATVKFDEPLPYAIDINLKGTRAALQLGLQLPNLVVYVHVSTAFSNCVQQVVEERIYPATTDWRQTLEMRDKIDESTVNILTKKLIGEHPNTYIYSKNLAEQVVDEYKDRLNILMIRPSIVTSAYEEPMIGWVDNLNGPNGTSVGIGTGLLRTALLARNKRLDFIPVDLAIKCIIVAASYKALSRDNTLDIYNCSTREVSPTNTKYHEFGMSAVHAFPFKYCLWKPTCLMTNNMWCYMANFYLFQLIPAIIVDGLLRLASIKPQLLEAQKKIYMTTVTLNFFFMSQFDFKNDNLWALDARLRQDERKEFRFGIDPTEQEVINYFKSTIKYFGQWLFKMTEEDFQKARKVRFVQHILDKFFKGGFFLYLGWKIYSLNLVPTYFQAAVDNLMDFQLT